MKKLILLLIITLFVPLLSQAEPILELTIPVDGAPAGGFRPERSGEARDVNGDGIEDLFTVRWFDASSPYLAVKSGASDETWSFPINGIVFHSISWKILGAYDLNPNELSMKQMVLAKRNGRRFTDVTILEEGVGVIKQFPSSHVLVDIDPNADDDDDTELLLFDTEQNEIELWGKGPALELFPNSFQIDQVTIDVPNKRIGYQTVVNGRALNIYFSLIEGQAVNISVENGSGSNLVNMSSKGAIPAGTDEDVAWLLEQNVALKRGTNLLSIWQLFKDDHSAEAQSQIGGILGGIAGLIDELEDIFCKGGGTTTCTTNDGKDTEFSCDCGIPICYTTTTVVETVVLVVDTSTGEQTTETQYKTVEVCNCFCQKIKRQAG
ncbi:hypothetical protein JW960_18880 [candidate division KSB1 bacterium]|nr:hypothetical protein [candidate division KSB1 bacterium]